METNHDLVNMYSSYIKSINPTNLAYFIESYIKWVARAPQTRFHIACF